MLIILLTVLAGLAFLQANQQLKLAADVEAQLHSTVMAENGVEYARHILPYLEIDELLSGADGEFCDSEEPEWRNPMLLDLARKVRVGNWAPQCDDGFLAPMPNSLSTEDRSSFLVRFTNNPEEAGMVDTDHIVIARSMGIVPEKISTVFAPEIKNCVTLLEVRLRQEVLFSIPSPLTIMGDSGAFEFDGTEFVVEGGDSYAVSLVAVANDGMLNDFVTALSLEQLQAIRGRGEDPSVTAGDEYHTSKVYSRLFETSFWRHFKGHLPGFADPFQGQQQEDGLFYLFDGGVLEGTFSGILVAQGDLILSGDTKIDGLLLHLGEGQLTLRDQAEVQGGIWLCNLDHSGDELRSEVVSLRLSGSCRINYAPESILNALQSLPATQLGWRIIFPEMEQSG